MVNTLGITFGRGSEGTGSDLSLKVAWIGMARELMCDARTSGDGMALVEKLG